MTGFDDPWSWGFAAIYLTWAIPNWGSLQDAVFILSGRIPDKRLDEEIERVQLEKGYTLIPVLPGKILWSTVLNYSN
jgi:hypothetical protein